MCATDRQPRDPNRRRELDAGCGYYASEAAFWFAGFGTAVVYLAVLALVLSVRRKWNGGWGWVLVALPLLPLWWLALPIVLLAVVPLSVACLVAGIRWLWHRRIAQVESRRRLEAQRLRELAPYMAQVEALVEAE